MQLLKKICFKEMANSQAVSLGSGSTLPLFLCWLEVYPRKSVEEGVKKCSRGHTSLCCGDLLSNYLPRVSVVLPKQSTECFSALRCVILEWVLPHKSFGGGPDFYSSSSM